MHHLEAVGFTAAPRVLGFDEHGREILTYLAGELGAAGWAMIVDDPALTVPPGSCASTTMPSSRTARRPEPSGPTLTSHYTTRSSATATSAPGTSSGETGSQSASLTGIWPGPGTAIDDVAYALEYAAPFRDDEMAARWLAYDRPPDRRQRIERFASAYGLTSVAGLVDQVIRRQRLTSERVQALAERGVEPQATWVANGYLDQLEARAAWSERHRHLFE